MKRPPIAAEATRRKARSKSASLRRRLRRPICKVSITTKLEAEDAIAELLHEVLGLPASTYSVFATGQTVVSVFCETLPIGFSAMRSALRDGLQRITSCGLNVGAGHISIEKLPHENWAESWKRHFKPLLIGAALLIKPTWSKRRARPGQAVVVLDPGLSFGTGQHPTTGFCLRQLAAMRDAAKQKSFLDIGTGSGILAIAAAKLGYGSVQAFDFDPQSVCVARANARANHMQRKLRITQADLSQLPQRGAQQYDLICANLLANLLIAERDRILARLKPDGALVVAGILKSEFSEVVAAYEAAGMTLIASRIEKEWQSGTFIRLPQV